MEILIFMCQFPHAQEINNLNDIALCYVHNALRTRLKMTQNLISYHDSQNILQFFTLMKQDIIITTTQSTIKKMQDTNAKF